MSKLRFLFLKRYGSVIFGILIVITLISFLIDRTDDAYVRSAKIKLSQFSIKSDYNYLINISFTFKILPLVCEEKDDTLLVLVHSATDNFNNRKVIRETWGQHVDDIKLLFLVGMTDDASTQEKLELESRLFRDLVQGSFLDTYHNLTYKHVMGLKYAFYHCPKIPFLLKVDDDTFVNMLTLKEFVKSFLCQENQSNKILCSRFFDNPVLREGKWAVSIEDFPEDVYPSHCSGFAILYPRQVIYSLYSVAQRSIFFWIDDVFVSGMCAKKMNISHIGIEELVIPSEDIINIVDYSYTNITKPFLLGGINLDEHQIRSLWQFVSNYRPLTLLEYLNYD